MITYTYKGKEYTWEEYRKKVNEDSEKLRKYAEEKLREIDEFNK